MVNIDMTPPQGLMLTQRKINPRGWEGSVYCGEETVRDDQLAP
jgi:hypothetical protein